MINNPKILVKLESWYNMITLPFGSNSNYMFNNESTQWFYSNLLNSTFTSLFPVTTVGNYYSF